MSKKKRVRTVDNYLTTAKNLATFAPSLRKYGRRKTLSRWEKSAITRKQNLLKHTDRLFPITKRQARAIENKDMIVGNGIRAISLRNTADDAEIHIRKGQLVIHSGDRTFNTFNVSPANIDNLIETAELLFDRFGNRRVTVWLNTKAGRADRGFRSLPLLINYLVGQFAQYARDTEQWIFGWQYLVE